VVKYPKHGTIFLHEENFWPHTRLHDPRFSSLISNFLFGRGHKEKHIFTCDKVSAAFVFVAYLMMLSVGGVYNVEC
jgi:hypothetical protein